MNRINLYLADLSDPDHTTGVDRYISVLINGLKSYPHIRVHWIHLCAGQNLLIPKQEDTRHCTKITIPLPQAFKTIVAQQFWVQRYNEQVYRLIRHLFQDAPNAIVHIHTLNLIDLARYIREQTGCKIITHLHTIPWKGLYSSDKKRFNTLYQKTDLPPGSTPENRAEAYSTHPCELPSYAEPDSLICVTRNAETFLKNDIQKTTPHITVIPNGMDDFNCPPAPRAAKTAQEPFRCLYVGAVSESKGIFYILNALRSVGQKGYGVSLTVAGHCTTRLKDKIEQEYPDLNIELTGRLPFDELKKQYRQSDIGIIGSLHEQASYTAIEMAMFGLPVVTTAVDGLVETFTDEVNALKVGTRFSPLSGLSVDVETMSGQIIRLIKDHTLRNRLSRNIRTLYETDLNQKRMLEKTVEAYEQVLQNKK